MIYYFSGTGNSEWVAEQLAELTGDRAESIVPLMQQGDGTIAAGADGRVGLVFPIYAWGVPKIMNEFVARLAVDPAAYAYAVCTCGDEAGRAMDRLKRHFHWQAAWSVVMPNNYIPMYDVDSPAHAAAKIAAARERLPIIAETVKRRERACDLHRGRMPGFRTAIINPFFKAAALSTKPFAADESCTGCGQCEKLCPRGAIRMTDGKPVWQKPHCLQCMACIHRCPARAIQYGEDTRQRGRYYFGCQEVASACTGTEEP